MQDTVEGYINHIIFRNEDNGYTVLSMIVDGEELTCVGFFQYISEGETIEAKGSYTEHVSYGQQFKIESYETKIPQDALAMERYLGSGAIKGLGVALAARIVRRFGEDTLRIMDEEPERLAEIKGISERKAREIAQQVEEKSDMRKAMIFLQQYGISVALGVKIYHKYGQAMYQILRENPYRMAEDVEGIGFKIADEIAGRIGIHTDSDYRIRSGILYVLLGAAQEGHIYLPKDVLLRRTSQLLGVEAQYMEKHLMDMAIDRKLVLKTFNNSESSIHAANIEQSTNEMQADIDSGWNAYFDEKPDTEQVFVYASSYYHLELDTARMLCELNVSTHEDTERIRRTLQRIEQETHTELDELQRQAVVGAVENGVMVITGGPGTGKTTTINAILHYFELEGLDIMLAAPTGRAAKRMTEATGYEAKTIHRLLEFSGGVEESSSSVHFERNQENPLEADVIIIDEMSMVDIHLVHALLAAVVVGTRLILVGDVDQLPSVGPGKILEDIIRSDTFPVVKLTKIFRQASESDIVVNAHRINQGEPIILDNKSRDFFFLKRYDANIILRVLVALIQEKLPGYVDAQPFDIQVLTPMRKGILGVENLNIILQRYLNPADSQKAEREFGSGLFREGDKVMQIKNNYQLEWEVRGKYGIPTERGVGVFNGDMGIIREINTYAETLEIEYDEGRVAEYSFKQLDELELAYAVTIHKSQGSEYPAVILPLLGGPRMLLNRNLLYTAVTRARKCVTIVGSEETFNQMVEHENQNRRYTSLAERIWEI